MKKASKKASKRRSRAATSPADYESLGAFYLGRTVDAETGKVGGEPLLYDAKDLTTHAVCVGMTGSGKTGLCVTLLEEAAIDGIPVIAIDPKGDLGNMLLTFPALRPQDFRPWIDEGEATRHGRTPDEQARTVANLWRQGLAKWDQPATRVARFANAVDRAIYTPGSTAGLPLSALRSFAAPAPALVADVDAFQERVQGAVSGLLALLGLAADPLRSREHILLATLFDRAWRDGHDLDLPLLIRQIQKPPVDRVGVMKLDSFFPATDRFELAMRLNGTIASPSFSAWSQGEPIDVGRMLYADDGRPRLSIVSIAHLSDPQRMFLVATLLHEIVAWMRSQPGSRTLRALLYMDEVFGYLPPTVNPPSKIPMLTLLKQARAYGLGVVLATQNPVDLDYKALSNAGTWFLGRLQTERDKARVIEGLEGASATTGAGFDRGRMERILAGLSSRIFLMNNVHEDAPVLFHTRWALSYLRGPLTREQIRSLVRVPPSEEVVQAARARPHRDEPAAASMVPGPEVARPVLPAGISERFLPLDSSRGAAGRLLYRPALLGVAGLHYAKASARVDEWTTVAMLSMLSEESVTDPWAEAEVVGSAAPSLETDPEDGAACASLPAVAAEERSYVRWKKMLATHLYRTRSLQLWRCREPKLLSGPGESKGEFVGRLRTLRHEERDLAVEKLRSRFAPKLARLQDQIGRAEQRVDVESSQFKQQKLHTAISIGATVVGALFGRKLGSARSVGRAATAMRGAGRAARERGDIARAEERVDALRQRLRDLEADFEDRLTALRDEFASTEPTVDEVKIAPRKSDLDIQPLILVWTPWWLHADGRAEAGFAVETGMRSGP